MPGEFTSPQQIRSALGPRGARSAGARDIVLAGCLINYYAK